MAHFVFYWIPSESALSRAGRDVLRQIGQMDESCISENILIFFSPAA